MNPTSAWRMHDFTQFMQGFLQRYTQWHNGRTKRKGHLWEDRFRSVIVEHGVAAYIDLNPVRAGGWQSGWTKAGR